jgi:hypothetical protein
MATTITKQPISPVDVQMDTAGGGSVTNFTRGKSDGTTESVASLSAAQVPVLDAPIVTSGRTPFELISPATDRDIEACLTAVRTNAREMKNFDHYGGESGTGNLTRAQRNTEVWRKILDDINSEGRNNGIYFPGQTYEFSNQAGFGGQYASHIIPLETSGAVDVSNIAIVGASPGTKLIASSSATSGTNFIFGDDVSNVVFMDIEIDRNDGNASDEDCVHIQAVTTPTGIYFDRCVFSNFRRAISLVQSGGSATATDYWVRGCTFNDSGVTGVPAVNAVDWGRGHVLDNTFPGACGGITVQSTQARALASTIIRGNVMTNTTVTQGISAIRSGSFSATVHRNITVSENHIDRGSIQMTGLSEWRVQSNRLFDGGIYGDFFTADATDCHILFNDIEDGGNTTFTEGIDIHCNAVELLRWSIVGGSVTGFDNEGIIIRRTGTARAVQGRISDVNVQDCAQAGADGSSSGILIKADASFLNQIHHNVVRSTTGSDRHKYAIEEEAGGANLAANHFSDNLARGWATGDYLVQTGAPVLSTSADNQSNGAGGV